MPIGKYKSFKECTKKNTDKSNPQAYCATIEKKTTGKWPREEQDALPVSSAQSWSTFKESQNNCPGKKIRSKGKGRGLGIGQGVGPIGRREEQELNPIAKKKKVKGGITEFAGKSKKDRLNERNDIIEMPLKIEGADYWINLMKQDSGIIDIVKGKAHQYYKDNPEEKKAAEIRRRKNEATLRSWNRKK